MAKIRKGWFKPYVLNEQNIEQLVANLPGVYVVGNFDDGYQLLPRKVASSQNVKSELKRYIGRFQAFTYKPFKHQIALKTFQPKLF